MPKLKWLVCPCCFLSNLLATQLPGEQLCNESWKYKEIESMMRQGKQWYDNKFNKKCSIKRIMQDNCNWEYRRQGKMCEFTLSHEAMIGLATEFVWLYEDINDTRKLSITTYQLEADPAPTQAIGFYLTPNSPMLVLQINSLSEKMENENECNNWKEIDIKAQNTNQYYYVKDPSEEECTFMTLESYELSKRNIMKIHVLSDKGEDITKYYHTLIFEINRDGIKDFATMLFVWANN